MEFTRQIVRMLHEDHMAKLRFLDRIRGLVASHDADNPPPPDDHEFGAVAALIAVEFAHAPDAHFALEEEKLFPLLADEGEAEIGALLTEEHREIEQTAGELLQATGLAKNAAPQSWATFRRLANALAGQLSDHIDKEEAALLPLLDETLSEDIDRELTLVYAENR